MDACTQTKKERGRPLSWDGNREKASWTKVLISLEIRQLLCMLQANEAYFDFAVWACCVAVFPALGATHFPV